MKKSWLIIISVIVVIAAATLYILFIRNTDTEQPTASQTHTASDMPMATAQPSPQPATATPGEYLDYNADTVAKTTGRKILFFYAPWCPQCRALEQSIKTNTIPAGVTIFKTDFDSSTELRQKYGVSIQTTLVEIDSAGNKIRSYTAYNTPDLQTVIAEMKL